VALLKVAASQVFGLEFQSQTPGAAIPWIGLGDNPCRL